MLDRILFGHVLGCTAAQNELSSRASTGNVSAYLTSSYKHYINILQHNGQWIIAVNLALAPLCKDNIRNKKIQELLSTYQLNRL